MITEMLVVLSAHKIDLVRAGLLADFCFLPHVQYPTLREVQQFPRWDRLNVASLESYNYLRHWIAQQRQQIAKGDYSFFLVIDRIIESFFTHKQKLSYRQMANLRALTETITHLSKYKKNWLTIIKKILLPS